MFQVGNRSLLVGVSLVMTLLSRLLHSMRQQQQRPSSARHLNCLRREFSAFHFLCFNVSGSKLSDALRKSSRCANLTDSEPSHSNHPCEYPTCAFNLLVASEHRTEMIVLRRSSAFVSGYDSAGDPGVRKSLVIRSRARSHSSVGNERKLSFPLKIFSGTFSSA